MTEPIYQLLTTHPSGQTQISPKCNLVQIQVALLLAKKNMPNATHQIQPPLPENLPKLTPTNFMDYAMRLSATTCSEIFGTPVKYQSQAIDPWQQLVFQSENLEEAVVRIQGADADGIQTMVFKMHVSKYAPFLSALTAALKEANALALTPKGEAGNTEDPSA